MLDAVVNNKYKEKMMLPLKCTIKIVEEAYETGSYSENYR